MKKFHLVTDCILLLLILAMAYWIFAGNQKSRSKEISNLTEQVAALKTELKDLQVLKDNLTRQKYEIIGLKEELQDLRSLKAKLQDLIAVTQDLLLKNIDLGEDWDSGTSKQRLERDSGETPSLSLPSEEVFKQQVEQAVAEIREKEREERQQRYTEMMNSWAQRRIERYAEELKLNDYQKEELGKIVEKSAQKMQNIFSNLRSGNLERDQIRTEMDKIRQDTDEKIQVVLYPDQYEQYKKIESERGGFFGRSSRRRRGSEQRE